MDRAELQDAYEAHRVLADGCFAARDWSPYADQFTEDATYRRSGHALVEGREAIREWICHHLGMFPATEIGALDVLWHSIDTRRSAVAYEVRATMRDPGDGSQHHASTVTTLQYAGHGLWASGADVNNPTIYERMFRAWAAVAVQHGTQIPPDAGYLEPGRRSPVA